MFFDSAVVVLTSFTLTAVILHSLLMWARHLLPVDLPNARSLHGSPIPRFGGIAMLAGSSIALIICNGQFSGWIWPVPVLASISLLDDFISLPAVPRFSVQLGVAAVFIAWLFGFAWWTLPIVIAMVWMTNLYNFMDGSDGLAASMTLAGFGGYAVLSFLAGDLEVSVVCLAIWGAALAFLLRNTHPASVFMGDAGSIPIGFLAGAIGVIGVERGLWSPWIPPMMFLVFIIDASLTLTRRLLHGEAFWRAHRTHYYQRMIQMGAGHAGATRAYATIMTGCVVSAIVTQVIAARFAGTVLIVWVVLLILIGKYYIDSRWQVYESTLKERGQ